MAKNFLIDPVVHPFMAAMIAMIGHPKISEVLMLTNSANPEEIDQNPITKFEAQQIMDALNLLRKDMIEQMREVKARFAMLSKTDIEVKAQLQSLREDMVLNRVSRLELEIDEGQRELSLLEERASRLKEQIEVKKKAQDGAVDTEEKIKMALEADARMRRERSHNFWLGVRESVIKGLATSLAIALAMSAIGMVWWLILLRVGAVPIR